MVEMRAQLLLLFFGIALISCDTNRNIGKKHDSALSAKDVNDKPPLTPAKTRQGNTMKGFITNIEKDTLANSYFRKVLYTAKHSQLVLMSLAAKEDIGEEVHHLDQFIRVESGQGKAILNGVEHSISDGFGIVIPAGTKHNIINTSDSPLKLYTIYSPPEHRDGTIHKTKAEAMTSEEEFDGRTSE